MGSQPSCREPWPVRSRAVWWEVGAAAAKNQSHRQNTKQGSLRSNLLSAPLLFSSTAVPFVTDQDLAADRSKIRAIAWLGGILQHLLSLPDSFCHWQRWCLPPGSHLLRSSAVAHFPYPQQLIPLLRELFGCAGSLLWGGPRNLGFASGTESCTHQEQMGPSG